MRHTLLIGGIAAALVVVAAASARAGEIEATGEAILEGHQMVATSCEQPRTFRRIHIKGGTKFARAGEVFAFDQRVIRAQPCEEIEVVFECARLTGASAAGESPAGRRRQATTSTPSHGPSFARMGVKR